MNNKLQCAFNVVVKYGFCGDCRWKLDSKQCHECDCYENGVKRIREALEIASEVAETEQAPIIDAVPVVRCRECKHFRHYGKTSLLINGKNIKAGWCQRRISYDEEYRMTADDFCSYGERKGGAE